LIFLKTYLKIVKCKNEAIIIDGVGFFTSMRIRFFDFSVSIRPATSLPGFIGHIALFNKTNAYGISKAGKDVYAR
jgi:hypothetical protein